MHIIARLLGPKARLRVDANNLFDDVEHCARHLQTIDLPVWAIEEPFRPRDALAQRRLAAKADIRIILDESAIHPGDLDGLEGDGWVVNLRVSKQGGLLRSIEMAEMARARGIDVIIGSHVGETSLLARSALVLAAACSDLVIAAECGYGSLLVQRDLAHPSLRFGKSGILTAQREGIAGRSGLGVTVDQEILNFPIA
jgi:L-alanine-DL-glutamate epimerase-like enolase superfamily enzyme